VGAGQGPVFFLFGNHLGRDAGLDAGQIPSPRRWNADRAKAGEARKPGDFQKVKFDTIKYK
jgi:hypothetical protein